MLWFQGRPWPWARLVYQFIKLCAEVYTFTMSRDSRMHGFIRSTHQQPLRSPPKVRLTSWGAKSSDIGPPFQHGTLPQPIHISSGERQAYTQFGTSSNVARKMISRELMSEPYNPHSCTVIPGSLSQTNPHVAKQFTFKVQCINIKQVIRSCLKASISQN